jgi:arylsulfatase
VSAKGGKWELYNLDNDRTELNDLSEKFPQRVTKMASEWFDIAKNKERLNQKGLGTVKEVVKQISFRRDTSDQLED